jgi:hypothetical protein
MNPDDDLDYDELFRRIEALQDTEPVTLRLRARRQLLRLCLEAFSALRYQGGHGFAADQPDKIVGRVIAA